MTGRKRSQNNGKTKGQTDSVNNRTKTNNESKRSAKPKKGHTLSQPTQVNIIYYRTYNEWI